MPRVQENFIDLTHHVVEIANFDPILVSC